ncbi:S8 family peptidase [Flavobacterium rhizosphaerae]|uniref:S8 family peptidase n=1 Tax=Flavobacterium rhizosphaerae TaxID=3163298 RepID=A0ABW8Z2R8_9FLAO
MKFRSLYLSAALALFLAGCGAPRITADPITIATPITAKKADLTETQKERWSDLDLLTDTVPGMSVDRAYELLKDRKSNKVVVGIVDSGVDIEHPDLAGRIWTNTKEIAGNGIDDDKNGYIDDVHGWNFLGDIEHENLEFVRIMKKGDDGSEMYKEARAEYEKEYNEMMAEKQKIDFLSNIDKTFQEKLGKTEYTAEDLQKLKVDEADLEGVKQNLIRILSNMSHADFMERIDGAKEHINSTLDYHLNLKFDGREILGDNADDWSTKSYGNNQVWGPEKEGALHGTHVAGIIAQIRGNGIGGDGVASDYAEIMSVRAVPDGDEYDKDVALAIRYAVDNGAKVINGSFGKYYSTHSDWVYDAIKYAAEKDVLIVCAAGNDGMNLNKGGGVVARYPNDTANSDTEISDNFLCIGALTPEYGPDMVARFSNYGKEEVDIFSPGVEIYATTPNDSYRFLQGTSMASPNAAGVAVLIRAFYPKLTASQVKKVIMQSGLPINITVNAGGGEDAIETSFSNLSQTGRIVNAYNAIILADKMSRGKM